MQAPFVANVPIEFLLDPDADPWRKVQAEPLAMIGTPLGLQPTAAIRVAWQNRRIGAVQRVAARALHNGEVLAFRLEWDDASENRELGDTNVFPDAAAVLFPATDAAPLLTMGAPGAAVNAWYWRADDDGGGRQVLAEGIGSSRTVDQKLVRSHGLWKEGRWHVVVARALRVDGTEPYAQLTPGQSTRFGVAVWEGSNGERGGIKSFSGDWRPIELAPGSAARRS
jgi:DMSO reductase family type II enzyme heme b subunit